MRISKVAIQGFRGYRDWTEITFGDRTTFVGKNDTGKSAILYALDIFLSEKSTPDQDDYNKDLPETEPIVIQVSFSDLPEMIQLEDGIDTEWKTENLLDIQGYFTVQKTYSKKTPRKFGLTLVVEDYRDEKRFFNLCSLKEQELNSLGEDLGLEMKKSGAGIKNKDKREMIRQLAESEGIPKRPQEIIPKEALEKLLKRLLPGFTLFKADEGLSEEATVFQKQFKAVIEEAIKEIPAREEIEKKVEKKIDEEMTKIHAFLKEHTDEISSIKAKPFFKWKDLVAFSLDCKDSQGKIIPLSKRGAGLRRLLMVAYFQYLAQRAKDKDNPKIGIYGIEEPETFLHPGAQRDLLKSLNDISDKDQIVLTSHSPVFAGSTNFDDIVFVYREAGVSKVKQGDRLKPLEIAVELGVKPVDQIFSFNALVFVDGKDDCNFFAMLSEKLFEEGKIPRTFKDAKIGFVPSGGNNLSDIVNRVRMRQINHNYMVIQDSDRLSSSDPISEKKLNIRRKVEADGGKCVILKKREIENYLHSDAIKRVTDLEVEIDDFCDVKEMMKVKMKKGVCNLIKHMTADEILERDFYSEDGAEGHELLEICQEILKLVN